MQDFIHRTRLARSKKLDKVGRKLIKLGISSNLITSFSLIFGLLGVYFLFSKYYLFLVFILLHIAFDAFDGVVARLEEKKLAKIGIVRSSFGKYFDHLFADGLVTLLLVAKVGWYLSDIYAYMIAGLMLFMFMVYGFTRMRSPVLFTRTLTVVMLLIYVPAFYDSVLWLTLVYLTNGVAAAWALARQVQWFVSGK